jgi:hypothetical protein
MGLASNNSTGTLAGTSTTTGVVPTSATAGCPTIESFNGGVGYLTDLEFSNAVLSKLKLFDMLWKGGAYAFNANTSGNTPTSFASRVPDGTDFTGTEIWLEQATAGTGNQNVNVTYINQAGTSGRSTGTVATGVNSPGQLFRLPLQAGDKGVQGVTGVVGSTATAGTFNILVLRPLWTGSVEVANAGYVHGIDKTLMPVIYDTSALFLAVSPSSAATSTPCLELRIFSG